MLGRLTMFQGRKYLDYDLEALYSSIKTRTACRVMLAVEDSEAFDSGLLSDLISLFRYKRSLRSLSMLAALGVNASSSWHDRLQFTLLFGIATSVDLFQARLPRSACQQLFGGQFDVAQTASLLDSLTKTAVARADTAVSIGPVLLRSFIERQSEQVAGIQSFISSLKVRPPHRWKLLVLLTAT